MCLIDFFRHVGKADKLLAMPIFFYGEKKKKNTSLPHQFWKNLWTKNNFVFLRGLRLFKQNWTADG